MKPRGSRFTAEEICFMQDKYKEGMKQANIARLLDRPFHSVKIKLQEIGAVKTLLGEKSPNAIDDALVKPLRALGIIINKNEKKRLCLGCNTHFISDGPHNRICNGCQSRN